MKKSNVLISLLSCVFMSVEAANYSIKIPLSDINQTKTETIAHGSVALSTENNNYNTIFTLTTGKILSGGIKNIPKGEILSFSINSANYYNSARGTITLQACASSGCVSSTIDLSKTVDNSYNTFNFGTSLITKQDDTLTYTITTNKSDGVNPFAIYAYTLSKAAKSEQANIIGFSSPNISGVSGTYPLVKISYK